MAPGTAEEELLEDEPQPAASSTGQARTTRAKLDAVIDKITRHEPRPLEIAA